MLRRRTKVQTEPLPDFWLGCRVFDVGIGSRQIEEPELEKLPKKWKGFLEMIYKSREGCLCTLNVGKRHHR